MTSLSKLDCIEEIASVLPEEVMHKFLRNWQGSGLLRYEYLQRHRDKTSSIPVKEFVYETLGTTFDWERSPEGRDYWVRISEGLLVDP